MAGDGGGGGAVVAQGVLAGTLVGCVDALVLARFGHRVPAAAVWWALALLSGTGLLAGSALALLHGWQRRRSAEAAARLRAVVPDLLVGGVALHGAALVLLDRADWRFDHTLVRGIGAAALLWIVLGPWLLPRLLRSPARWFVLRVALLAGFFYAWSPLTERALAEASETITWGTMGGLALATFIAAGFLTLRRGGVPLRAAHAGWGALALFVLGGLGAGEVLRRSARAPLQVESPPPDPALVGRATTDVLFIVMDTTRRDHLSVYGYERETTPRLEEFAREAERFDRALSTSSWTLPAHASMFTGMYASTHGAHTMNQRLAEQLGIEGVHFNPTLSPAIPLVEEHETLAEVFARHGYRTGAVVGNTAFLDRVFGLAQGFEYWDDRSRAELGTFTGFTALRWVAECLNRVDHPSMVRTAVYRRADVIREEALAWLDADDERPAFLFLNFMDPHGPYHPPVPFDRKFPGFAPELERNEETGRVAREVMREARPLTEREHAHYISRYDGEIAFLDHELGLLFDALRERGRFDDTLIVITSDHGESLGERGYFGHGSCLNGEEIDVPLLIRYPGGSKTGVNGALIGVRELPRLIGAAVGLELPEAMVEHLPLDDVPACLAELFQRDQRVRDFGPRFERDLEALRIGPDLKVILSSKDGESIFDLESDPLEEQPLSGEPPDLVADAIGALGVYRSTRSTRRAVPTEKLSPQMRDALRRLGYEH